MFLHSIVWSPTYNRRSEIGSMEDLVSNEDFLKAFGVSEDTGAEGSNAEGQNDNPPAGADPGAEDQTPPADTTGDGGASNTGDNTGDQTQDTDANNPDNATSKSAQAFAAMRVELANKNRMLENVATVLGLDPKSKDSMDQLQSKLTDALAKKQGISPEILNKLNRLEEMEQQRSIEQTRQNAFLGFQKVKTQFGLDDNQLQEFANQLVAEGKNPFTTELNLVNEYKLKNFDKLLEQARNQGTQAEMERAAKAQNNATTPSQTTGGTPDATPEKITTVKELTNWFNQQQSGK